MSGPDPLASFPEFARRLFLLALKRKESDENYLEFQRHQASRVVRRAADVLALEPGMTALDFGGGGVGYSLVMVELGLRVTAVDMTFPEAAIARGIAAGVECTTANLLDYRAEPVDFVFCASVIEHVEPASRDRLLQQIRGNLKSTGRLYLSFPPFWSPIGGHTVAPFHYLPDGLAFELTKRIKGEAVDSYEKMWGTWGLFKTSIGAVEQLLKRNGFKILSIESRYMPAWYSGLFRRNNFLNWHAEFFCERVA